MPNEIFIPSDYEPGEKQIRAHNAKQRWTMLGGGEGSGKTRFMVEEIKRIMLRYPGIEGVCGRLDQNDVFQATQIYDAFHRYCPPELIPAGSKGEFRSYPRWTKFHNGSRVTWTGFKDYSPSSEYGFAAIDQAEEVDMEVLQLVNGRLRQRLPNGKFPHFRMLLTCNPHPNMEWFLKKVDEYPEDYLFIQSLYSDNKFLPKDFLDQRRKSYTKEYFARLIEGSWDAFAGQALCFDSETEILTLDGFKTIGQIAVGDMVATRNSDGRLEYQPATHIWRLPYSGILYKHETENGINFAVTPNHRMLLKSYNSNNPGAGFTFCRADEMPAMSVIPRACIWEGCAVEFEEIPAVRYGKLGEVSAQARRRLSPGSELRHPLARVLTVKMEPWLSFLGWYIAEGSIERNSIKFGNAIRGVTISQRKQAGRELIERCLVQLPWRFSVEKDRYRLNGVSLANYLEKLGKVDQKYIPRKYLSLPPYQLQYLFDGLMGGDGCKTATGWTYSTVSKPLADDVFELCTKLGYVVTVSPREDQHENHKRQYVLTVSSQKRQTGLVRRENIKQELYNGEVWCVTVPPHNTIYARRKGRGMWTGNSEWNPAIHVIDPTFDDWRDWPVWLGIDFGTDAPTVGEWVAVSPSGTLFFVQEYERVGAGPAATGADLAELSQGMNLMGVWLDPRANMVKADLNRRVTWSVWDEYKTQFKTSRVPVHLAKASRTTRLAAWQQALHPHPDRNDFRTGEPPAPAAYVFYDCKGLIRTIPRLQYERVQVGEAEDIIKTNDHWYDAGGFVLTHLLKTTTPYYQVKDMNVKLNMGAGVGRGVDSARAKRMREWYGIGRR